MLQIFLLFLLSLPGVNSNDAVDPAQPIELGDVNWLRDFEQGQRLAEKEGKPIFLLFQEVPGCGTCQRYGQEVLRHPLIVEAIETLFIPVAIYNNKGGADREVLDYYKEPAWNNPVVRIVKSTKQNIISRVAGNYSTAAVVEAMFIALKQSHQEVPQYLELLYAELNPQQQVETAFLSMYCFWTGEQKIASFNGVVETQPGFMEGHEVVKVKYDPSVIAFDDLVKQAENAQCASKIYTESAEQHKVAEQILESRRVAEATAFRLDADPKYYLSKTDYRFVPMTQLQAARVNSAIGKGRSPDVYLSNAQLKVLKAYQSAKHKKWKSAINVSLMPAWDSLPVKA